MNKMSSFLERYLDGECQQVWDDLLALDEQIREEPIYSDALAVARETMQRTRRNIEILIPRLESIGYQFGYSWTKPSDAEWVKLPVYFNCGKVGAGLKISSIMNDDVGEPAPTGAR